MQQRYSRPTSGRALGQFLPKVTKKAFEKYGFATASLATDWAVIVGEDWARKATPERISWPRRRQMDAEDLPRGCVPQGATLILRVKPAHALEIQYSVETLSDRVNSYFGYRAIEKIRILQGEFDSASSAAPARAPRLASSTGPNGGAPRQALQMDDVRSAKLKSALERLAANVLER